MRLAASRQTGRHSHHHLRLHLSTTDAPLYLGRTSTLVLNQGGGLPCHQLTAIASHETSYLPLSVAGSSVSVLVL